MSRSATSAQAAAKLYLEMRTYKVIEQNWRRSRQQIDIVAEKNGVIYLVSVQYQPDSAGQSNRVRALSASQLQRQQQAAAAWLQENKWSGRSRLAAVEVADPGFMVISFADNLA